MANYFLTKLKSVKWKNSSSFNKQYWNNQTFIWGKKIVKLCSNFMTEIKVKWFADLSVKHKNTKLQKENRRKIFVNWVQSVLNITPEA